MGQFSYGSVGHGSQAVTHCQLWYTTGRGKCADRQSCQQFINAGGITDIHRSGSNQLDLQYMLDSWIRANPMNLTEMSRPSRHLCIFKLFTMHITSAVRCTRIQDHCGKQVAVATGLGPMQVLAPGIWTRIVSVFVDATTAADLGRLQFLLRQDRHSPRTPSLNSCAGAHRSRDRL